MKERLTRVLFWALVLHVIVAVIFIIDPPFLRDTRVSLVYKKYVVPGPFFKDSQLVDNHSLMVSWKVNDTWTSTINVTREDFNRYHAHFNPSDLYRSRLNRTLLLKFVKADSSGTNIKDRSEFNQLKQFICSYYVPEEADSVSMSIINNQAQNFMVRTDSVNIIFAQ